ncbi:MAG: flagellar basal body-associated protein FliL [Burkholderiaceae bacterium]
MSDPKAEDNAEAPPKKKGKLIIIIVALVLLLGGGGAAAFFMLQKPAEKDGENADQAQVEEEEEAPVRPRKKKPGEPPIFVEMEAFVFNLQDTDQDRFAQVAVTLEVIDAEVEAELGLVEPSVRNAILMLMSSKTSNEILSVQGKQTLAEQIVDFANSIMAGEEPPALVPRSNKRGADPAKDGYQVDQAGKTSPERARRVKYIPERVTRAHFKQFIVQ